MWMPPRTSDTATTLQPRSTIRRAVHEPTLPKPWIATVDAFERLVQVARRLLDDDDDAASGRGFASEGAAELDRLAR